MIFTVCHMIADPVTCSYDPAKGGRQTVTTREAPNREALVRELTGKGLYAQGHGQMGRTLTVSDPHGPRWACYKITPAD